MLLWYCFSSMLWVHPSLICLELAQPCYLLSYFLHTDIAHGQGWIYTGTFFLIPIALIFTPSSGIHVEKKLKTRQTMHLTSTKLAFYSNSCKVISNLQRIVLTRKFRVWSTSGSELWENGCSDFRIILTWGSQGTDFEHSFMDLLVLWINVYLVPLPIFKFFFLFYVVQMFWCGPF